ncbi:MAG: hypothetical protein KVP17_002067 [Porospora cf. gigantea B]|uniref:uncharacterized protein n=1 Tax=Porospora cf. gigantea B TaxID=2853592 RepID=UPI003571A955|nr:MAG: hypothetical protein KVP17_002067 [Porospora cf. gigantea B]
MHGKHVFRALAGGSPFSVETLQRLAETHSYPAAQMETTIQIMGGEQQVSLDQYSTWVRTAPMTGVKELFDHVQDDGKVRPRDLVETVEKTGLACKNKAALLASTDMDYKTFSQFLLPARSSF